MQMGSVMPAREQGARPRGYSPGESRDHTETR